MAEDKFEQAKGNLKTVGNVTDNKDLEKKVKTIKLLVKPRSS